MKQPTIYTLTFNPAIDYIIHTDHLVFGQTNRSTAEALCFGGKGINVSVILSRLGAATVALGFVAGFTGAALTEAVNKEGVATDFIVLPNGLTRINLKLKGNEETEINAGGPEIPPKEQAALLDKLDTLCSGDTLVLAGSIPRSLPKNTYEQILKRLAHRGIRFVVDTVGEALLRTLPYRPFLIKPNLQELEELVNRRLKTNADIIDAAKLLQKQGAIQVLVSLGSKGAILLDESGKVYSEVAHSGKAINTVGAGDSMLAGFLVGIKNGPAEALKLANAAGAATAFSKELATRDEIFGLLKTKTI